MRTFQEICADLNLFQTSPGEGFRILGLDEKLQEGDEGIEIYSHAIYYRTGYTGLTPRRVSEIEYFHEPKLRYFNFRRKI